MHSVLNGYDSCRKPRRNPQPYKTQAIHHSFPSLKTAREKKVKVSSGSMISRNSTVMWDVVSANLKLLHLYFPLTYSFSKIFTHLAIL